MIVSNCGSVRLMARQRHKRSSILSAGNTDRKLRAWGSNPGPRGAQPDALPSEVVAPMESVNQTNPKTARGQVMRFDVV